MRKRLAPVRIVGALLLLAIAGLLSLDLIQALGGQACAPGAGPDCYPWGAEGPAAGRWSYASKTNYLLRGGAQLVLLIAAGTWLILRAGTGRRWSGPARGAVLLAAAAFISLFFL
ncbi:MAG TPA: hypothetical protein VMG08_12535 [Allosphingosinicella sp.]|nr:hypothetical protein [Allosphingosinicella sp.]